MLSSLQSNLLLFGLLARAAPDPTASSMATVASLGDDLMPGTTNGTLSLNITATTAVLNVPTLSNQSAVTNLFTDLASNNYNVSLVNGTRQLSATYEIWTSVCIPTEPSPRNDTLVILTHGIGFGHQYFSALANFLCENGYVSVVYDRLGVGSSSKPDGIEEVQLPTEIAVLGALMNQTKTATGATKVVLIGHSFGSLISHGLAAEYPASIDGLVLTGFSLDTSGQQAFLAGAGLQIASQSDPVRFAGLNNSYVITGGVSQDQLLFLKYPYYDPDTLTNLQATKGTATVGELLTQNMVQPASNYTNATYIGNGVNDLPFCGGNCSALSWSEDFGPAVPNTKNLTVEYYNNSAHGIELQYVASQVHDRILGWLGTWVSQ